MRLRRSVDAGNFATSGGVVPIEDTSLVPKSKSLHQSQRKKSQRKSARKSALRKAGDFLKGTLRRPKFAHPKAKLGKHHFEEFVWEGPESCEQSPIDPEKCPMFSGYNFNSTELLGQGRFSELLKAAKVENKGKKSELIAVKIIKYEEDNETWTETMIEKESRILFKLNHPNIVKFLWMHSHAKDKMLFIAFELIPGCTFGEVVDEFPQVLTESRMKFLMKSLISAINHCHTHGVVHHDLNLGNFMLPSLAVKPNPQRGEVFLGDLDPNDSNFALWGVKLIDFGLSVEVDETNLEACDIEDNSGSPAFSAPEIFHEEVHNCKIDIYSLGVIMFVGLSQGQKYPYDDFSWLKSNLLAPFEKRERIQKHMKRQRKMHYKFVPEEIWSGISRAAKDLTARMLHVNHRERPMASMALRHVWFDDEIDII